MFLSPVARGEIPASMHHTRLRLAFKEFSRRCKEALQKNKQLVTREVHAAEGSGRNVQREFQNEMQRNYNKFVERLTPLIAKEGGPMEGTLRRSPKKRHLPIATPVNAAAAAASSTPAAASHHPPLPPSSSLSHAASPLSHLITSPVAPGQQQQQQPHPMHAFRQSSLLLNEQQDV